MLDKKNTELLIKIGSYQPKYVAIRILIVTLAAWGILNYIDYIVDHKLNDDPYSLKIYLLGVLAFNSVSEINLFIMRIFQRHQRLRWNIYLQISTVIFVSILLTIFWLQIIQNIVWANVKLISYPGTQIALLAGLAFILIHLLVGIISNLLAEWIESKKEIDALKQAKLQSDYNSLKDRLNPHFLFNNLSVLKSLIKYDPSVAEVFTQNFTNVYRYVLKSHEEETVALQEELKFLESYIALHKERIGEGLVVKIDIKENEKAKRIPPLSMQLLVENAIKHNVTTKTTPLNLEIKSEGKYIKVRNTLNKKDSTYSTHTGLKTLKAQYLHIANREVEVLESENSFEVRLPLL